jgi:hypothetical protein
LKVTSRMISTQWMKRMKMMIVGWTHLLLPAALAKARNQ